MPVLPSTSLLHTLVSRNTTVPSATSDPLSVICAWPVSGQYGPGSRVLYYVLVAACVFARKSPWLRNPCLAAALLFPAVAALHGIVLAAVHVDGAVDMDVYGAFQLCSIGILAAPVTVKLSRTYFYNRGRNTIFLWTGLILAGLLSLTVEFFRAGTSPCTQDDSGTPISPDPAHFPYGATCGLVCTIENGPFSPLRGGSANNIYVIPAPVKLAFGTATLLAAACCIPAVLSLISMWNKILEINWKTRFGNGDGGEPADELIEGTNGATAEKMRGVNDYVRRFLRVVEIPVFGAAVLTILILGEWNLFSPQVFYQTEPIASIGQWAPIVGTGLAVLGSLYLLLAAGLEDVKEDVDEDEDSTQTMRPCNCTCAMQKVGLAQSPASPHSQSGATTPGAHDQETPNDLVPTPSHATSKQSHKRVIDAGNRRKVAKALIAIGDRFSTAAEDRFNDYDFKHGKALDFPEIPGEENRNSDLPKIRKQYNQGRDADGSITPQLRKQASRGSSFHGSTASRPSIEAGPSTLRASLQSPQSPRSPSPSPSHTTPQRPRGSTLPAKRNSFELQNPPSSQSAGSSEGRPPHRRATLGVRSLVHRSPTRNSLSATPMTSIFTAAGGLSSPTIVVSPDPDTPSRPHTPPEATSPSSP